MRIPRALPSVKRRFHAAFQQIAAILEQEEHNDASLFRVISGLVPHNPLLAVVISNNIANILDQHTDGADLSYTQVLTDAYRVSLFERTDGFDFYDAFENKPEEAEQFAINFKTLSGSETFRLFASSGARPH